MILRSEEKLGAGAKFKHLIGLFARKEEGAKDNQKELSL